MSNEVQIRSVIPEEAVQRVVRKGYLFPSVVQEIASQMSFPHDNLEKMRLVRDELVNLTAQMMAASVSAMDAEAARFDLDQGPVTLPINERRECFFFANSRGLTL